MPTEQWKTVSGFPDYEVSDLGRIATARRGPRRMMRPSPNTTGYPTVQLYIGGQRYTRTVHSLVAAAFLGERPAGMDICHGDGDKTNAAVVNLRYDTRSANIRERRDHGTDPQLNKTKCPKGHAYDTANTYIVPARGHRSCRACAASAQRASRARRASRQAVAA